MLDVALMRFADDLHVAIPSMHRVHVAVDCECGTTVVACDDGELLDELLEHIAAAHEAGLRQDPAAMLTDAYDA